MCIGTAFVLPSHAETPADDEVYRSHMIPVHDVQCQHELRTVLEDDA